MNVTHPKRTLYDGLKWLKWIPVAASAAAGLRVVALMLLGGLAELLRSPRFSTIVLMADPPGSGIAVYRMLKSFGVDVSNFHSRCLEPFCVIAVVAAAIRISLARSSQKFVFRIATNLVSRFTSGCYTTV